LIFVKLTLRRPSSDGSLIWAIEMEKDWDGESLKVKLTKAEREYVNLLKEESRILWKQKAISKKNRFTDLQRVKLQRLAALEGLEETKNQ